MAQWTSGDTTYHGVRCQRQIGPERCTGFATTPSGLCLDCASADALANPCPICGDTSPWPWHCDCPVVPDALRAEV
jgi:hypothetical protein